MDKTSALSFINQLMNGENTSTTAYPCILSSPSAPCSIFICKPPFPRTAFPSVRSSLWITYNGWCSKHCGDQRLSTFGQLKEGWGGAGGKSPWEPLSSGRHGKPLPQSDINFATSFFQQIYIYIYRRCL